MIEAEISDGTGTIKAVWFSKIPIATLKADSEYVFEGRYEHKYGRTAIQMPEYTSVSRSVSSESLARQTSVEVRYPERSSLHTGNQKRSGMSEMLGTVGGYLILGLVLLFIFFPRHSSTTDDASSSAESIQVPAAQAAPQQQAPAAQPKVSCKDVTSIDYNWGNDVLCTNPGGSTFYTDYAGGRNADPGFQRR